MIYIDTGAFLARYLTKDQHHKTAVSKWSKIEHATAKCYTSNFILDETLTLLGRRIGHDVASETGKAIYNSQSIIIIRPDLDEEMVALDYFEKYADQKISFTDCVSFALMKKHRIKRVFTFDRHFSLAGFSRY